MWSIELYGITEFIDVIQIQIEMWRILLLSLVCVYVTSHGHMPDMSGPMIDGFQVKTAIVSITQLLTSQITEGMLEEQTQFKTSKLVHIDKIGGKFLFFTLVPFHTAWENMKLSVFREKNHQKSILECSKTKDNMCWIESTQLTLQENLLVDLSCSGQCGYQFSTYWSDAQPLSPGTVTKFTLTEQNKPLIYHINVDHANQFQELRIIINPSTKKNSVDSVKMYADIGFSQENRPVEKHELTSIGLLNGAEGIFLSRAQLINQDIVSLTIIGSTKTVFDLNCELVVELSEDLLINKRVYEYIGEGRSKKFRIDFTQQKDISKVNEFEVGFSKIAGDFTVQFFKDKDMTQKEDIKYFQYMKDSKFIILEQDLKKKNMKEIFINVKTKEKSSIMVVELITKSDEKAVEVSENIYSFLPISKTKIFMIRFQDFTEQQNQNKDGLIFLNVNMIKVFGDVKTEFRFCQHSLVDCLSLENYQKASTILTPVKSGRVGMKNNYKLKIQEKFLHQISPFEKAGVVIAIVQNLQKQNSLIAVDYTYLTSITHLRENHPIQEIVDDKELKYYRFSISDPSVVSVKINVFEIEGGIKVTGSRSDPRNIEKVEGVASIGNIVEFTNQLNFPMYVIVEGVKQSSFSITVQVVRNLKDPVQSNLMSISEDVSYPLRINPKSLLIIQTNPVFDSLYFNFRTTSGNVGVCLVGKDNKCAQQTPIIAKSGQLKIEHINDRNPKVLLTNANEDKFVEVFVSYHSANYEQCEIVKIGQLYNRVVKNEDCFNYPLKQPFENIFLQAERIEVAMLSVKVFACFEELKQQWLLPRMMISGQKIAEKCEGKQQVEKALTVMFLGDKQKQKQEMKIQFTAHYQLGTINLIDGVAFRIDGQNTEGVLRLFYYKLVNKIDTRIILRSYRGDLKFYVKIVQNQKKQLTTLNQHDHQFASDDSNIFQNPTLLLTSANFQKAACQVCGILIAVQSTSPIGFHLDFSVEVVQNNIALKDNQMVQNHLMKDSVAYYDYESIKDTDCNIIVEVADHNKDCSRIYLSDLEYPSEQNNLAKEYGNKLTYPGCKKGHYFIGIEASDDCPYAISVSNSAYSVVNAERGQPVNIKLEQGEYKYIIFRHITSTSFKIVTMEKFGKVSIFADVLNEKHLNELRQNKIISTEFKFKSEFSNTLRINPEDEGFCSDCYYIAAIYCQKQIEASVILADEETSLTLNQNKILNDQLFKKGQKTNLTFSGMLAGSLPITVYNGIIKVDLKYQKESVTNKFQKSLLLQIFEFKLKSQNIQTYQWDPIYLTIQCLTSNCVYSIGLIDQTQAKVDEMRQAISRGRPTYVYFQKDQSKCFTGYLEDADEEIIVTVQKNAAETLNSLQIKITVDGKENTKYKKDIVSNVMIFSSLTIDQSQQKTIPYELCLTYTLEDSFSSIIQQGQDINLLAENVERVVTDQDTFVVYPTGSMIVDIFECEGTTTFTHSNVQKDLDKETDLQLLKEIGIVGQPHAIKITSYIPVFLKVKSPLSIIRWLPVDENKQIGVGYIKYAVGSLTYETTQESIVFLWNGVSKKGKTLTVAKEVDYRIYISTSAKLLKSASECQRFLNQDVIFFDVPVEKDKIIDSEITFKVSKKVIQEKFKKMNNLYVNIVADMELLVKAQSAEKSQSYRFLYPTQEIPLEIFKGNTQNEKLFLIIAIISISLIAILILAYVFVKKIVPMVSRMNSRVMIEEDNRSGNTKKYNDQNPLPSNDRIMD